MSNYKIKLNKPCSENWNDMTDLERGKFCSICSKEVIDMTSLKFDVISDILTNEKDICGKIYHSQVTNPASASDIIGRAQLPYSKIAAGILLASTLSVAHTIEAKENSLPLITVQNTEVQNTNNVSNSNISYNTGVFKNDTLNFKAKVVFESDRKPIENADVMFVSATLILKAKTDKDGFFTLKIPTHIIDEQNLFRITHATSIDRSDTKYGFESRNYILNSKNLQTIYQFNALEAIPYMGAVTYIKNAPDPVVLYKGSEIDYKIFDKALDNETKKFDMSDKYYYFFDESAGVAIYGHRAYFGLYLVYDK